MNQATPARPIQTSPSGADGPFPSPLLREVTARFEADARHVILEPGAVSAGILDLLRGRRCRLLVADATEALCALSEAPPEPHDLTRRIETLLFDAGGEPIDTVLCWDLLNYLSPPILSAVATRLAAIMTPTGIIHAYIHSAHATMPRHPQRYTALEDGRVARVGHAPAERKAPRYSAWDLEKHAIGLRVERSMLLRNGLQEYLLRVDPTRSGPRDVKPIYRNRRTRA